MKPIYKLFYSIIILLDLIPIYFAFNMWIENGIFSVIITGAIGIVFVYILFWRHFKKRIIRHINSIIFIVYSLNFMIKTYDITRGSQEYMMLMYPIYMVIAAGILIEFSLKEK